MTFNSLINACSTGLQWQAAISLWQGPGSNAKLLAARKRVSQSMLEFDRASDMSETIFYKHCHSLETASGTATGHTDFRVLHQVCLCAFSPRKQPLVRSWPPALLDSVLSRKNSCKISECAVKVPGTY